MVQKMGERNKIKHESDRYSRMYRNYSIDLGARPYIREPKRDAAAFRFRPLHLRLDIPLLIAVATILVLGLVILYSASYDYSRFWIGDPYYMITRQLIWLGIGLIGLVFFALFDYHYIRHFAFPALMFTLGLLVLVLTVNQIFNNAARSILSGSIRPSELAKLVIVVYTSVWLYARQERLTTLSVGLAPLSVVLGAYGGLILAQPDLSAVVTVFFLGTVVFFLAGGDLKQLGMMLLASLVVGLLVFQASATASERIRQFVEGWKNPENVSDHVRGALESFANGKWLGTGLGKGEMKLLDLPVAPTDSIFAVIGEELGVVGAAFVVGLFVFLLWRGLKVSRRAPDQLGALLAAGLTIWLVFEAFVNMAVVLNILPFAGNALPFVSFGGSSLVVSLAAIGIIMNVARQSVDKESEREFGAVINLRGRNRRRRVSSLDHVPGRKG
jgi:cell division protein FtsW